MAIRDSPFLPSIGARTYVNPRDKKAVRMYQTFHKLPVTGQIDARTAKHMRNSNTRVGSPPKKRRDIGYSPPARRAQAPWQGTRRA
jgi:peptidoglycan hydrolase-like protein with peptidoglycan-binding domain